MKNFIMKGKRKKFDSSYADLSYSDRIAKGWGSRSLAAIILTLGLIGDGLGIFLAYAAGQETVDFWSNFSVWLGISHLAYCIFIGGAMLVCRWRLTAFQAGLFMVGLYSVTYFMQGASALSTILYSNATVFARVGIAVWFFGWQGWWVWKTVNGCGRIWNNTALRNSIWLHREEVSVYQREAAKEAMVKVALRVFVGKNIFVLFAALLIPLIFFRHELVAYLHVPFIHIVLTVAGAPLSLIGTVPATFSVVLLIIYSSRVKAERGRPVLFDMMNRR